MELSEFVKTTIEQIVDGVIAAQSSTSEKGASVNPASYYFHSEGKVNSADNGSPQNINFDVGLTTSSKMGGTEGIGVFLGSVNLGKKNDKSAEELAVTRVQFTVPVMLPKSVQKT